MAGLSDILNNSPNLGVTNQYYTDGLYRPQSTLNEVDVSTSDIEDRVSGEIKTIDKEWFDLRFIPPKHKMDNVDAMNRFYTTAVTKFEDTSLGGSLAINARAQFCQYSDIRSGNRIHNNEVVAGGSPVGTGMGRIYSEVFHDNQWLVYLSFGVPRFNGLMDYMLSAIDYKDSYVANHGRMPATYQVASKIGEVLGTVALFVAYPLAAIAIWSAKLIGRHLLGESNLNYYYLEPAMLNYWSMVNTLVSSVAVELGILMPELLSDKEADRIGSPAKFNKNDLEELSKLMPGLISEETGFIDVAAISSRTQALANKMMWTEYEEANGSSGNSDSDVSKFYGYVYGHPNEIYTREEMYMDSISGKLNNYMSITKLTGMLTGTGGDYSKDFTPKNGGDPAFYGNKYTKNPPSSKPESKVPEQDLAKQESSNIASTGAGAGLEAITTTNEIDGEKVTSTEYRYTTTEKDGVFAYDHKFKTEDDGWWSSFATSADSMLRGGSKYAIFAVNYTGSVSESFSNQVGDLSLGMGLKSVSSAARDLRFNLADGNIFGHAVKDITDTVSGFISGSLSGMSAGLSGVVQSLLGNAFVDLPKKWEDSEMSLPSITYTMHLRRTYNTPLSAIRDEYIPLCMILAGVLPQSAGRASYSSPLLCELFVKGVQHVKMGMITSVNVTRGTSNLGYDHYKKPLGIDVSFTVTDFSTIVAGPLKASNIFESIGINLDDASPIGRYIATICSRDLVTTKYMWPKAKLNLSRTMMNLHQRVSSSFMGLRVGEKLDVGLGAMVSSISIPESQRN